MPILKRFPRMRFVLVAILSLALVGPLAAEIEDDDEPLELGTVVKGASKTLEKPTEVPTAVPTAVPAARPTPRPVAKPVVRRTTLTGVEVSPTGQGINIIVRGNGSVIGSTKPLTNPDRILVVFRNARMGSGVYSRDLNQGTAVRLRFSQKTSDVWMVVDLLGSTRFLTDGGIRNGYGLTLLTGGAAQEPQLASAAKLASLPKSSLMFFDKNVMFNGKQYDQFPCANFIYDKADKFPLKRKFDVTMVFFDGNLSNHRPQGRQGGPDHSALCFQPVQQVDRL